MRVLVRALCAFLGFFRVLSLSLACFMIVLACSQFGLQFIEIAKNPTKQIFMVATSGVVAA
jgi:hypothetical protein